MLLLEEEVAQLQKGVVRLESKIKSSMQQLRIDLRAEFKSFRTQMTKMFDQMLARMGDVVDDEKMETVQLDPILTKETSSNLLPSPEISHMTKGSEHSQCLMDPVDLEGIPSLTHVSDELQNNLLEVSKPFLEERTSLENYACHLNTSVGICELVEAVGIRKGKTALTRLFMELPGIAQVPPKMSLGNTYTIVFVYVNELVEVHNPYGFRLLVMGTTSALEIWLPNASYIRYTIVSTGGTASVLENAGISVTKVEQLTCSPDMFSGRVKTLHPNLQGGILARRDQKHHMEALNKHGIGTFDVLVVNLYPFYEKITSTRGIDFEDNIENIDIGGLTMIRVAAKNHKDVLVVVDSQDYPALLDFLKGSQHD